MYAYLYNVHQLLMKILEIQKLRIFVTQGPGNLRRIMEIVQLGLKLKSKTNLKFKRYIDNVLNPVWDCRTYAAMHKVCACYIFKNCQARPSRIPSWQSSIIITVKPASYCSQQLLTTYWVFDGWLKGVWRLTIFSVISVQITFYPSFKSPLYFFCFPF